MKRCEPFFISGKAAKKYGAKAAAVLGLVYEGCQKQAALGGFQKCAYWMRAGQEDLARQLHLCRQTVAKILRKLDAEGFLLVRKGANADGRDRTRWYSLNLNAFLLINEDFRGWQVHNKTMRLSWGLSTGVASRLGVNAAIVFQYLWHWMSGWSYSARHIKDGRVWLSYSAASLARWLPFLSAGVVRSALKRLLAAGLLLRRRDGRLVKWAIADEGLLAMTCSSPALLQKSTSRSLCDTVHRILLSPLTRNAGGAQAAGREVGFAGG